MTKAEAALINAVMTETAVNSGLPTGPYKTHFRKGATPKSSGNGGTVRYEEYVGKDGKTHIKRIKRAQTYEKN